MSNDALVQDELLFQVTQVLEEDYPAGPSFVHALSTIVEAAVLHDVNYFDPMAGSTVRQAGRLENDVYDSPFTQELMRENVLTTFRGVEHVAFAPEDGEGYTAVDFMIDYAWTHQSSAFRDLASETAYLAVLAKLLDAFPGIFRSKRLTDEDDDGDTEDARALLRLGMPRENLIVVEAHNHRQDALVRLATVERLNLYTNQASMPSQIGTIKRNNSAARALYAKLRAELKEIDDDDVGSSDFEHLAIPELTGVVLRNAKGDVRAIAPEIAALRARHEKLRRYLGQHETEWRDAKTKRRRHELQMELQNAWSTFVAAEKAPKQRWIYKIWNVFKSPTRVLSAVGDELVKKGEYWAVAGQVRGLHAVWKEMLDAPTASESARLLQTFPWRRADAASWAANRDLARALEQFAFDGKEAEVATGGRTKR